MEYFLEAKYYLLKHHDMAWFYLGLVLFLVDFIFVSGLGLVFFALGALSTGGVMYFKLINLPTLEYQVIAFFSFTFCWAIILWGRIRIKKDGLYKSLIGTKAYIGKRRLKKGKKGIVAVSGRKMKARISPHTTVEVIEPGTEVWIHDIEKNILLVGLTPHTIRFKEK